MLAVDVPFIRYMLGRTSRSMNPKRTRIFQVLIFAGCGMLSTIALAQENVSSTGTVSPRLAVMPPKPAPANFQLPSGSLPEWNGFFVYNGTQYNYVMVGADPS